MQKQNTAPTIARHCPQCKAYSEVEVRDGADVVCPKCQSQWGHVTTIAEILLICPVCENKQFYLTKDFNQAVGCLIMLIGICLVPWTYGLSLPVFAGIDWLMYRKVAQVAVCYKCAAEFRGLVHPPHLKPFLHHIGLKYDKYR